MCPIAIYTTPIMKIKDMAAEADDDGLLGVGGTVGRTVGAHRHHLEHEKTHTVSTT